jgi:hypothetical protein
MICWNAATDWGSVSVCQIRTIFFSAGKTIMGIKKVDIRISMAIPNNFLFLNISAPPSFLLKIIVVLKNMRTLIKPFWNRLTSLS